MPTRPSTTDDYLAAGCGRCELGGTPDCKVHAWHDELELLRSILRRSGLNEQIKWGVPCYTHDGHNIALLSALKDSVTVSFLRGALLSDPHGFLEKPGPNSRFARYARFTDTATITKRRAALLAYVREAIALEEADRPGRRDASTMPDAPPELLDAFAEDAALATAFRALTPGRQRGYLIHFGGAKQSATRRARIARMRPRILAGKGWNER